MRDSPCSKPCFGARRTWYATPNSQTRCGVRAAATSPPCTRICRCCARRWIGHSPRACCTPCMASAIALRTRPMNDAPIASPRWRLSLRARVALTFAGLGLVVSACVTAVAMHFSDAYVHRLVDEMLRVEGEHLRDLRVRGDGIPNPPLRHFDVYGSAPGET